MTGIEIQIKEGRRLVKTVNIFPGAQVKICYNARTESGYRIPAGSVGTVRRITGHRAFVAFPGAMETLTLDFDRYTYPMDVVRA